MTDTMQPDPTDDAVVTLQVRIRAEHAAVLRACAAREGASAEALAALWLEEKADEARQHLPGLSARQPPARDDA